jgi:carbamoyl-phosphate synthase large subunit
MFGNQPVFMKPRQGRGSRGVKLFNNYFEIPADQVTKDMVFSENLPGQEYTVDVLCDLEGKPLLIIPRKRLEIREGKSVKGETQRHGEIEENVKKLCNILKIIGPANIQFKPDSSGRMKLVEINPRFSGGLPITAEAGANTPGLLHCMLSGDCIPPTTWVEGVFDNKLS